MKYDLIIVGSGPAGLSAGIEAAKHGAKVMIVDENPFVGGKLIGQLHEEPKNGWWIGKQVAESLAEEAKALGVVFLQEREVWGIFPKWTVKLNQGEELHASFVLIATGAAEKAIPIAGWTLPGVMAIGAAQVMNNYHRVQPGKKVAIVGIDPLALTVAHEMKMGGVDVVGLFLPPSNDFSQEKSRPKEMISDLAMMSHLAPNVMLKIAGRMARNRFVRNIGAHLYPVQGVKVWDIPLSLRKNIREINGDQQVESITVDQIDAHGDVQTNRRQTIEVDCVCISGGLYPVSELPAAIGCASAYIEELGGHVPLHGEDLQTTQDGIYVAGNITGIEGANIAMAQGELVGFLVSKRAGFIKDYDEKEMIQYKEKIKEARETSTIKFMRNIDQGREKVERRWRDPNT
ncbi:NAD(P)/FAD-dependent oxidoreductase [Natribacillus halophilus]|uniref:Sarcosine oxidase subunit alpha n=1 Tax=Natribacillus halophilus TaxID=549003 RepID=A0A1G8JVZ1_9BACI|nr:FAD-dependent oxidoreductase [Natribacillus halophilus]SDI35295.1 sarcosine oxidase subunit alpha [Natribacillus halophilus]